MANPLLNIHAVREDCCKYPVALKVAMDDGTVQTYELKCEQHPSFLAAMQTMERMVDRIEIIGYQYKPRRKNRIHRDKR